MNGEVPQICWGYSPEVGSIVMVLVGNGNDRNAGLLVVSEWRKYSNGALI